MQEFYKMYISSAIQNCFSVSVIHSCPLQFTLPTVDYCTVCSFNSKEINNKSVLIIHLKAIYITIARVKCDWKVVSLQQ